MSHNMRFPTKWYVRPAKETAQASLSLHLSNYHIVGNHMLRLNYTYCIQPNIQHRGSYMSAHVFSSPEPKAPR